MNNYPKSLLATAEEGRTFEVTALTGAYHFTAKPAFRPQWECYEHAQIFLIQAGSGSYRTEEGEYRFAPGMMLYRPAHERSIYEWDSERAGLAIINFVCTSPAMAALPRAPFMLYGDESATLYDLVRTATRVKAAQHEISEVGSAPVPSAVYTYMFASLERFLSMVYCRLHGIGLLLDESATAEKQQRESALAEDVRLFLDEHVTERLTLADVCTRFRIGQTALCRAFRREAGRSVMDYFIDAKLLAAKRRIARGEESFTEIAEALGFSSVNYFSKLFRRRVGITPTEYSRRAVKRRFPEG